MIKYCYLMLFLLGASVATSVVILNSDAHDRAQNCAGAPHYTVSRLADAGDVGAMIYVGQSISAAGCPRDMQRRGMQYLARAAKMEQATQRGGGRAACLGLLAMYYPFEGNADLFARACQE